MDNGLLLVNFGALQNASGDIERALKELQTKLEYIEQEGKKLLEAWDGPAQAAYFARQEKWRSAARDLSTILREINVAVDDSALDYQATERRATNRFQ